MLVRKHVHLKVDPVNGDVTTTDDIATNTFSAHVCAPVVQDAVFSKK